MSLTTVEANNLLNGECVTGTSFVPPTGPLKLALVTSASSAGSPGTEVTGGSYARQTILFGTPSAGSVANTAAVTFASMPAATVIGIEIWDSAGTPLRKQFGAITSQAVSAGNTLSFAISAITSALA